jgi:hypothetical protein
VRFNDLQRVAVAHELELGCRAGFALHGVGENSAERHVRAASVRGVSIRAVGVEPPDGQLDFGLLEAS